jgi:hypothetical protein
MDLGPDRGEGVAHFGDFFFERFQRYFASLGELLIGLLIMPVDSKVC